MKKWTEVLETNEDKIIEAMLKANWDALNNQHMRIVINIDEDGDIYELDDIAGGNSFSAKVFNGEAIEIKDYCYQYFDEDIECRQETYEEYVQDDFDYIVNKYKEMEM